MTAWLGFSYGEAAEILPRRGLAVGAERKVDE